MASSSSSNVLKHGRRNKLTRPPDENEEISKELFNACERLKDILIKSTLNLTVHRQELLDQYEQLILYDLDYALEKKIEHDLWTLIFKNAMNTQQELLKEQPKKRVEIQTHLQFLYDYAKGYYLKLFQVMKKITRCRFMAFFCFRMWFMRIILRVQSVN